MSEHTTTDGSPGIDSGDDNPITDSGFDPEIAADRDAVEYAERTYVHGSADHCEADAAGRAVVGVTDEAGRALVLVDRENGMAILPNEVVDGDDWRPAARRAVAEATGLEVAIDEPIRIRRVQHTTEDAETPHNRTWHVVFEATAADSDTDPQTPEDAPVSAEWCDGLPVEPPADQPAEGDVLDDVRAFLR